MWLAILPSFFLFYELSAGVARIPLVLSFSKDETRAPNPGLPSLFSVAHIAPPSFFTEFRNLLPFFYKHLFLFFIFCIMLLHSRLSFFVCACLFTLSFFSILLLYRSHEGSLFSTCMYIYMSVCAHFNSSHTGIHMPTFTNIHINIHQSTNIHQQHERVTRTKADIPSSVSRCTILVLMT